MLLKQLLLGHRQLHPEKHILERVLVQDVMGVEGVILDLEIETEIPRAQPVERLAAAGEAAQRLARVGEIRRADLADGLDRLHLRQLVEPVQLAHALFGKGYLIHGLDVEKHPRLALNCAAVSNDYPRGTGNRIA